MAMVDGRWNRAALPVPSVTPATPASPANVLTTPAGVIFRIVKLLLSATKKFPALSIATSVGPLNSAALPVPSTLPMLGTPANVVNVCPDTGVAQTPIDQARTAAVA